MVFQGLGFSENIEATDPKWKKAIFSLIIYEIVEDNTVANQYQENKQKNEDLIRCT